MSSQAKIHFADSAIAPPAYSPPPAYAAHTFDEDIITFAQKERIAAVAESKLGYLVSQKRREPSLRHVLLHASFLERVLDSLDNSTPEPVEDAPLIDEYYMPQVNAIEVHSSLTTIVEVDEMEVDEDEEDEDMPPLERTVSHRPGSPVSDEESDSDSDSDDELSSPPPSYTPPPQDHPLFSLFEVREKARREELGNQYRIAHSEPENLFFMANNLAVAA